jgi:hypothetical protein
MYNFEVILQDNCLLEFQQACMPSSHETRFASYIHRLDWNKDSGRCILKSVVTSLVAVCTHVFLRTNQNRFRVAAETIASIHVPLSLVSRAERGLRTD